MAQTFNIGTRSSRLAMAQAVLVKRAIERMFSSFVINIVPISTQGDDDKQTPLSEIGGKGVFIKTLEEALIQGRIDGAVHSLKDVTTQCAPKTRLMGYLRPDSRVDCMVFANGARYKTLAEIPQGCTIATSSLRRKALLSHLRPDIICRDIRGNIDTRIAQCEAGHADAVLLSEIGLLRLGMHQQVSYVCDPTQFTPAPGQGVIAIQTREESTAFTAGIAAITDQKTAVYAKAERFILESLGFDCNYPIGIYCTGNKDSLTLDIAWSTPTLTRFARETLTTSEHHLAHIAKPLLTRIRRDVVLG